MLDVLLQLGSLHAFNGLCASRATLSDSSLHDCPHAEQDALPRVIRPCCSCRGAVLSGKGVDPSLQLSLVGVFGQGDAALGGKLLELRQYV